MDSSFPWKSYQRVHRFAESRGHNARQQTTRATSSVAQINRLFALCRPQTTEPGRIRPRKERTEARASTGQSKSLSRGGSRERRFRCRNPPTILSREQLERNVVYDEPFGVLQHYVLDGKRDADQIQTAHEEGRRATENRRIPGPMFKQYRTGNRSASFIKQATAIHETTPKEFFSEQIVNRRKAQAGLFPKASS